MKKARRHAGTKARRGARGTRGAFTLMEAIVAITILLLILLATSKIFSSASQVSTLGQANADVMQEITAIQDQIRQDFARLSRDGYFAIVSRAVRNDINDPNGTTPDLWLNPDLPADAYIRSDQLVFFTQGVNSLQVFRRHPSGFSFGDQHKPQATAARVYYGHGFQLGNFDPDEDPRTHEDIAPSFRNVTPWYRGNVDLVQFPNGSSIPSEIVRQPPAREWTLARQNILLADDSPVTGDLTVFLDQGSSAESIWIDPGRTESGNWIRNSRVDAAATQMNDIRDVVFGMGAIPLNDWIDQRDAMLDTVFYPRAERIGPSTMREDHATSISVLGTAVSDFIIEWTYEEGTGRAANPHNANDPWEGVGENWDIASQRFVGLMRLGEQVWFGLPDGAAATLPERGVQRYHDYVNRDNGAYAAETINPEWIEPSLFNSGPVIGYFAVFGYNQSRPLDDRPGSSNFGSPWNLLSNPPGIPAYTPWPSAIRITMRIHDARTRLTGGREVQFVVNLPRRVQ